MSFRDDGDALLARNAALEAENAKLRDENEQLKGPPSEQALVRKTPKYIEIANREPWWKKAFAALVWVAAILIAIAQGLL